MHDWGEAVTVTRYLDSLRFEALEGAEGMGTGPEGRIRNGRRSVAVTFEAVYVFELRS